MSLRETIEVLLEQILGPRLDYLASYEAVIVGQAVDGTLEVEPDDTRLHGMTGVPLRTFLPGVDVKVKPGGRVTIGFDGGNPKKPHARLFDGGALDTLTITAVTKIKLVAAEVDLVDAGGQPIARQSDMVASGGPAIPFTMQVGTPIPVVTPSGPGSIAPGTPIVVVFPLPLYGSIVSGNPANKS